MWWEAEEREEREGGRERERKKGEGGSVLKLFLFVVSADAATLWFEYIELAARATTFKCNTLNFYHPC